MSSGTLKPWKLEKMEEIAEGLHFLNSMDLSILPGLIRAGSILSTWFVVITIMRPCMIRYGYET